MEVITTLLEQTENVHALSLNCFLIEQNRDTSMNIFCSMIPNHIKYLKVILSEDENQRIIDDMTIILHRLKHLWNVTFQFDPFHTIQSDWIFTWLTDQREDFLHRLDGHCLHVWLGKSKAKSS